MAEGLLHEALLWDAQPSGPDGSGRVPETSAPTSMFLHCNRALAEASKLVSSAHATMRILAPVPQVTEHLAQLPGTTRA